MGVAWFVVCTVSCCVVCGYYVLPATWVMGVICCTCDSQAVLPDCLCPPTVGPNEKPPPELAREHYNRQEEKVTGFEELVSLSRWVGGCLDQTQLIRSGL